MMNNEHVRPSVATVQPAETRAAYIQRLADEAKLWSRFALDHSGLSPHRVQSIALDAVAFTAAGKAKSLAIPTKLVGTSEYQDVLEAVAALDDPRPHPLHVEAENGRLMAYFGGHEMGWLWDRHSWAFPLISAGARLYLLRITGTDDERKTLGANVAVAGVAAAIRTLTERRPSSRSVGGDGAAHHNDNAG